MKYLPLVWAGLWRKPTRTALTFLSIVVAFVLFGLLQSIGTIFDGVLKNARADFLVTVGASPGPLPIAQLHEIEAIPGVRTVAFAAGFSAYFRDPSNTVFVTAVEPERLFSFNPEWTIPRGQIQAMTSQRIGLIVGRVTAKKYGWKIGDRIPLHSTTAKQDGATDWAFDIVGIYDVPNQPSDATGFFVNYDYIDQARAVNKGTVDLFLLRVSSPDQATRISAQIDKHFANSGKTTRTQSQVERTQALITQIGDYGFFVRAVLAAVFFTILLITGNTIMQSVRERISEFAVLKTLGFSDWGVSALIGAETLTLCTVSAILGLALSSFFFPLAHDAIEIPSIAALLVGVARPPLAVMIAALLVSVLLAIVSGLPPALRAKRLVVVDALAGR